MTAKKNLTQELLLSAARDFADAESSHWEPRLFGVTDGKAVGTHLEHKFQARLHLTFTYDEGSSAKGIDFPGQNVDMKVTSVRQPQSSCPFKSARQKVYGLGYSLLVFVYSKEDDQERQAGRLDIQHVVFIDAAVTADYQTTKGLLQILDNDGNDDDLIAFMADRNLPLDDIQAQQLAKELIERRPNLGYLTISNALQWRLQYKRVIEKAGAIEGIFRVR